MKTNRSILVLLCAAALASCEKNAVQNITEPFASGARIKFFNFGVNAPQVNFYANDSKVTAVVSATGVESTIGTAFGAAAAGGFYAAIDPGSYSLKARISAATDKDLAISNLTTTLADGKSYSFYLSGFYNTTAKTIDSFVVEDNFTDTFDYSVAYVRFVNAISNSAPMAMFVTPSAGTAAKIGGEVAYKSAGNFVSVPAGVYTVSTRVAGSSTDAISRAAISLVAGRIYTISSRGDMTVVSTTATNRPFLDLTANR